jgi:hypothetical protein
VRIVGLGGSLARASRSRAALKAALAGVAEEGAETELLDLRELALPMYDPDQPGATEPASRLIESCHAADGLLWSSPLYQGTISGAFKNALDWLHEAVPYVVPIAGRGFDSEGRLRDETVGRQLRQAQPSARPGSARRAPGSLRGRRSSRRPVQSEPRSSRRAIGSAQSPWDRIAAAARSTS